MLTIKYLLIPTPFTSAWPADISGTGLVHIDTNGRCRNMDEILQSEFRVQGKGLKSWIRTGSIFSRRTVYYVNEAFFTAVCANMKVKKLYCPQRIHVCIIHISPTYPLHLREAGESICPFKSMSLTLMICSHFQDQF